MMTLDRPPPVATPPLRTLREWYCRHCGKLLGRFDRTTLRAEIRCPRCGVDNRHERPT